MTLNHIIALAFWTDYSACYLRQDWCRIRMVVVDKLVGNCTLSQAMVLVLTWALRFGKGNGEMFRGKMTSWWFAYKNTSKIGIVEDSEIYRWASKLRAVMLTEIFWSLPALEEMCGKGIGGEILIS